MQQENELLYVKLAQTERDLKDASQRLEATRVQAEALEVYL